MPNLNISNTKLTDGWPLLYMLIGSIAAFWLGNWWLLLIGAYLTVITMQNKTIQQYEKLVKTLRNNINYNRYTRNCVINKKTKTLISQQIASGVLIDVELQAIDNLEDEDLPLTRTFHISVN